MFRLSLHRTAFLFLFLPVLSVAQLEIAGCKSYEPTLVTLHGILVKKTFAGPPNYRDIHKGDEPEAVWLLKLESPICVDEDRVEPDLNPSQRNVRKVQLVLNKKHSERANVLLGKIGDVRDLSRMQSVPVTSVFRSGRSQSQRIGRLNKQSPRPAYG